jgi:dihydrofolate reductase
MELGLIYARARNGVIGADGGLPWHLPEDLAHFKRTTDGCPVVMGRHTWDSLPPRFRPLPGRMNIVCTRQPDWSAEGAHPASSLRDALALCAMAPHVWVIGGAQLYREAEPHAVRAVVTEIDADFPGDAFAPSLDDGWERVSQSAHQSASGLAYQISEWRRPAGLGSAA